MRENTERSRAGTERDRERQGETDRKLTSLFFFGTRNQLHLILNGQVWKSSLPERER